ncbi:MAG: thymidine phosphorylase [Gemmatimonadetes bacterium]|nr:thymidine phosphorylase [Gemmatimonadota bacterium]
MTAYRIIQRKRDGETLSPDEIRSFLRSYSEGNLADEQMAAFLMAVVFRGLSPLELDTLVDVMLHSGEVVDLGSVRGTKVDKHSTGGVGDKISLVLAPLVASLGVPVPMMSGRGLGHSGGTVDKLESIPGFRTALSLQEFRTQMERIGCALIAQTAEIAPLDRRMYALRDATATVESIPLIASSIMSKKLAEGLDALVLDVKLGNGAFMPDAPRALELARTMIAIGERYGRRVVAVLTAMDRPLGVAIGNSLEVVESIDTLRGGGPADVREVTLELAAEMLVLGGAAESRFAGRQSAEAALADGRALEKMREIVAAQGGDASVLDRPERLRSAPVRAELVADHGGVVAAMDVRAIGLAAVALGAGRGARDVRIDPAVGFHVPVKPGERVESGQRLATVFARDEDGAALALDSLRHAIRIDDRMQARPLPLVIDRIGGEP